MWVRKKEGSAMNDVRKWVLQKDRKRVQEREDASPAKAAGVRRTTGGRRDERRELNRRDEHQGAQEQ